MKTLLVIILLLFMGSANATYYSLVSCEYKYIPELLTSKYVGTYRSQFGNLFVAYFDTYCPAAINQ